MKHKLHPKSVIGFIICLICTATCAFNVAMAAQTVKTEYLLSKASYKVIINGTEYTDNSLPILNYDGYTYAPMRSMLEAADLKVDFANGVATVSSGANSSSADSADVNEYMTVREIFESSNLKPAFNRDDRTIEVYDDKNALLLVIPKEYTKEADGMMTILKAYYESDLKPLIDTFK